MSTRFVVAAMRLSYKDHGGLGSAWSVIDTLRGVSLCRTDSRVHADRIAAALNGHAHAPEGVYADGRRALFCQDCNELLAIPA